MTKPIFTPIPANLKSSGAESARQHTPHHKTPAHNRLVPGIVYSGLLLGFFYVALFSRNLLDSPVQSMTESLPLLVLLQCSYCIFGKLALPLKHGKYPSFGSQLSTVIIATILAFILSCLVFVLVILFGAPITSLIPETYLCAVHISMLSVLPLIHVYNLDASLWCDIISVKLPLNSIYGAAVGTWLGAWMGAIPIPLDWDRPWQQWPITILAGAYLGTSIGAIVGGLCASCKQKANIKQKKL